MEIVSFFGYKQMLEKRIDADLMTLSGKLYSLKQTLNGYKARFSSDEGMFENVIGRIENLERLSSELLTLHGLGDASAVQIMKEIKREKNSARVSKENSVEKSDEKGSFKVQKQPETALKSTKREQGKKTPLPKNI